VQQELPLNIHIDKAMPRERTRKGRTTMEGKDEAQDELGKESQRNQCSKLPIGNTHTYI